MRRNRGSAIAETGPALLLLLVIIVFPLVDLIYLGTAYGFSWFLHNAEMRELALSPPDSVTAGSSTLALQRTDTEFLTNAAGVAKYLGVPSGYPNPKIQHTNLVSTPPPAGQLVGSVQLTTTVTVRPWLNIPFFHGVPGLGGDVNCTFTSVKPQEENGQN